MFSPNNAQTTISDTDWINELAAASKAAKGEWHGGSPEGELAVDVLETAEDIVVVATMAGARREDISIHLQNDFLTIRGRRELPVPGVERAYNEECFWGNFSRTIVLPVDVEGDLTRSEYHHGVLTIHLPKAKPNAGIPIIVVEE